jgi:hypothetical protein
MSPDENENSGGISTVAIVGMALGGAAMLISLCAVIVFCRKTSHRKAEVKRELAAAENDEPPIDFGSAFDASAETSAFLPQGIEGGEFLAQDVDEGIWG